jgi:MFS family permease
MASPRATLATVMLVSFMSTAGIALPYPVLAPYFLGGAGDPALTAFLGIDPKLLLGLLLAVYPLGILIGSSFLGALSDHYGRKRVLVLSLVCGAIGYFLTAAAVLEASFPLLVLARFVTGLCEGNDAIARAVALDLHPRISRTRALSLMFSTTYVGWLAGPLAGGYLMAFGMGTVFGLAGVALIVCALVVAAALAETGNALPAHERPRLLEAARSTNSLHLWRDPAIRTLLVFHLLFTLGLNACYEFYPLWLVEHLHYDSRQIAWITVYMTAAMTFTSVFLITRLRARFASLSIVKFATAVFALLLGALGWTPEVLVPLSFVAFGMVISMNSGCFPEYMAERFHAEGSGRIMGLLITNFCFGNMLIALAGSLIALAGTHWTLLFGAGLAAVAVAWLQRVPSHAPARQAQPAEAAA